MRAFYVEAEFEPKPGYKLSERELSTRRAARGNSVWKNIRGSVTDRPDPHPKDDEVLIKVGLPAFVGRTHICCLKMKRGTPSMMGIASTRSLPGMNFPAKSLSWVRLFTA